MNSLEITQLNLWYGKQHALKNLSLPIIYPGEVVGLIGPNAAGKSTLLKSLLWPGNAEQVATYNSNDITHISRKKRSQIFGLMTQTPPQASSLTPYELLWSLARALNLPLSNEPLQTTITEQLELFGLREEALKPLESLSGGKRQLVGLTMLLLRSPDIYLLDEPTSALDLHWRLTVLSEMRNIIKSNEKIAIIALHDLNLALKYCDKLILLNNGELIASGKPLEVLTEKTLSEVYQVEAKIESTNYNTQRIEIIAPIKTKK
ncbi:ABC transporter ATP-binding protein [Hyphomicrobiales bacterium 4NK60-0047b]